MAGGAAAAAAMANAVKASGSIVRVESSDFLRILEKQDDPLVVISAEWMFGQSYKYLTSYKGLTFFAKSSEPIHISSRCEIIECKKIWIPG